ncbi:MAG: tetratricopeptide repeat protein [Anaerolineae bacterium]|jgi:tetratricopeptide (TPR) repeat protein
MARAPLTELLDRIRRAVDERQYDDGAAIARVILGVYPKCVQASRILAEALWENGLPDEAEEAFLAVLERDPEDFVAYAGLGLIAEQRGSLDKAVNHLRRASELAPNSEEVRGELIRLYQRQGQADSGKLKISRAALARIYARSEMPTRAIAEYQAVLQDEPDRMDIRLGLAEVLWREGNTAEAKEQAETVLKYLPDSIRAQLILAAVSRAEGREQHAQELLAQVAAADPLGEYGERLFGTDSPLPLADPMIEVPDYLLGQGTATDTENLDLELPDWLVEEPEPPATELPAEEPHQQPSDEPFAEEPEPSILSFSGSGSFPEPSPTDDDDDDTWLRELRPSPAAISPDGPQVSLDEAWDAYKRGDLEAALAAYGPLVEAEVAIEDVIQALTIIVADTDNLDATELLGDAHVRAGHYRAAMDAYNRVLRRLES